MGSGAAKGSSESEVPQPDENLNPSDKPTAEENAVSTRKNEEPTEEDVALSRHKVQISEDKADEKSVSEAIEVPLESTSAEKTPQKSSLRRVLRRDVTADMQREETLSFEGLVVDYDDQDRQQTIQIDRRRASRAKFGRPGVLREDTDTILLSARPRFASVTAAASPSRDRQRSFVTSLMSEMPEPPRRRVVVSDLDLEQPASSSLNRRLPVTPRWRRGASLSSLNRELITPAQQAAREPTPFIRRQHSVDDGLITAQRRSQYLYDQSFTELDAQIMRTPAQSSNRLSRVSGGSSQKLSSSSGSSSQNYKRHSSFTSVRTKVITAGNRKEKRAPVPWRSQWSHPDTMTFRPTDGALSLSATETLLARTT